MTDENPNEKPLKTFRSRIKGGRMGVAVQIWRNYTKAGRPFPVYKIDVGWRKNHGDAWKPKTTWNSSEIETLYHILKMDAIPYGYKVLQGQTEEN